MVVMRAIRGAIRGVRQELGQGESGWVSIDDSGAIGTGGYVSTAGPTVSPSSAMSVSAAWRCVRTTSELVGSLPLAIYERTDDTGGKRKITPDLAEWLTFAPNPEQTAMEFWEGTVAQMVLRGNAYAERLQIGSRTVGLKPLFGVTPKRLDGGGFEYEVIDRGKREVLPAEKVFHTRGFGSGDGLGLSAIKYGANSLGAALAADETSGSLFKNRMIPSSTLEADQSLDDDQRAQLQSYLETFAGSGRAGKTLVLEHGLKYKAMQMNPEDAQLLETRRFSVEDVCRWFGVPPIVIGHASEGQTMWGSGVEAIMLSWLTLGINPLLKRIEARILRDLIPVGRRRQWFVEWNREAMLQMDSAGKAEFLSKMINSGLMSADEGRDKLNQARRGGVADDLLIQGAMVRLDSLAENKGG